MLSPPDALQGFSPRLALLIQREGGRGKKQAFARKIGVKPQQLSRYLKGQIPDAPILLAIAAVGQVSVDWLLTGRESGVAVRGSCSNLPGRLVEPGPAKALAQVYPEGGYCAVRTND